MARQLNVGRIPIAGLLLAVAFVFLSMPASAQQFRLTVSESGTGTGTVMSTPAGINCPATSCSASFASGTGVTLTQTAGNASSFAGWNGTPTPCTVTPASCAFSMPSAVETVTAAFTNGTGLAFANTSVPNGLIGVRYGTTFYVLSTDGPFTYAVIAGSLPAGLTLDGNSGHLSGTPTTVGTSNFTMQVTNGLNATATANFSITITALPTSTAAQLALLKGKYALLFRGVDDSNGTQVVSDNVASFNFDGAGNFSVFYDGNGLNNLQTQCTSSGTYVVGPDDRGLLLLTTQGTCVTGNQGGGGSGKAFAFALGDIKNGVASTARIIDFAENAPGESSRAAGVLRRQDPTAFTSASLAGTYVLGLTGQDPSLGRAVELALVTLNNSLGITNLSFDQNDNGTLNSATLTGSYTTPDTNGRSILTVAIPGGTNTSVIYIVSANEMFFLTLDPATTNLMFAGDGLRQFNPNSFGLTSLQGPDILSYSGPRETGTNAGIGLATASVVSNVGHISVTSDSNDGGNLNLGQVQNSTYTVAPNGRAIVAGFGRNLIVYFVGPDRAFFISEDPSDPPFGQIEPQVGAPFSASPFVNNLFIGQDELVPNANSDFSGVAVLAPSNVLNATTDESGQGGDLSYGQLYTLSYTVDSTGHFTAQSGGQLTGYLSSPYKVTFFDTTSMDPEPVGSHPSTDPQLTFAQSIPQLPGVPSPATTTVNFATPVAVGSTAQSAPVTFMNAGVGPLTLQTLTDAADFSAAGTCVNSLPVVLAPGQACQVVITFAPGANTVLNTPLNETITVSTDAGTITITAIGTATGTGTSETLTVNKAGTGTGTVTSNPSGINCGATCSANFASGTLVALTAAQTGGSTFSGWGGACTNAAGTCTVTMSQSQTVTATFTAISLVGSPGPFAYVPIFGPGVVSVFDVSTDLPVATIPVGAGPVYAAVSPNGSFVYATNFDSGSVSVINSATNTVVASIPVGSQPFGIAITPDSSTVYVAVGGSSSNFVSVIDATTQSVVETVSVGMSPGFVVVTPDGRYVYVSNGGSNSLSVIQVATNTVIATIPVGAAPQSVAVSPDGKDIYVVCPGSNVVSVVDTASNVVVKSIPVTNGPYGISITPDGSTAYVAEYFGAATAVIDLTTGTVIASVPVGTNPRGSGATPDGASIWQTNLSSSFISVISTTNNTVTASVPVSSGVYNVAIASAPRSSQSITQPLNPTAPNTFNYGPHSFTVQYPPGTSFSGVNMTVVAAQATPASIQQRFAGTPFANAVCIVYSGTGGNCLDYQASCTNMSGNSITCPSISSPTIAVKSSFDTLQPITNPGFLTAPIGTDNWKNIFDSFFLQRIDPTMKGRTSGFSEFVAVDLGAKNSQGAATFQFQAPLESKDQRMFPVGTSIPVSFQLTSVANPGIPVTDAIAGITVVMLSPTTSLVLEKPAAFTYSGGNYTYSLNTSGYAPGTYNITVYGNAFVAQQVEFTLTALTGPRISTTLQSLTLNGSTKQYAAVFKISNTGGAAAKGLAVTASKLDSTATVTSLPASLGNVNPAASVNVTLLFPETAGAPNSSGEITISESYAGGTSGGGFRVTLP